MIFTGKLFVLSDDLEFSNPKSSDYK